MQAAAGCAFPLVLAPAILVHGSMDFFLMAAPAVAMHCESCCADVDADPDFDPDDADVIRMPFRMRFLIPYADPGALHRGGEPDGPEQLRLRRRRVRDILHGHLHDAGGKHIYTCEAYRLFVLAC